MKQRLDQQLVANGLASSRSQAESLVKLGLVMVNNKVITKPGFLAKEGDRLKVTTKENYVSRAGLKLASVAEAFEIDFKDKVVLDVGSSTGGFTDFALKYGARKVFAVDVGTNQLHSSLRMNERVELREQTDIRDFAKPNIDLDIILIDVSFISQRLILSHIHKLCSPKTIIISMVKPQFEATKEVLKNRGVIKNEKIRREILKDFETWVQKLFKIADKADSQVSGGKGNVERFYLLRPL